MAHYVSDVVSFLGDSFQSSLVHAAVGEALLNGILHGILLPRGNHSALASADDLGIQVDVEMHAGPPPEATVRIGDPGTGFDWATIADGDALARGRGIPVMRAGSRRVEWNERGNVVTLTLGVLGTSQPVPPPSPSPPPWMVPTIASAAPPRLLLVDDVDVNLQLFEILFQQAGYEVKCADSGQAALQQVVGWRPDVALVDFQMPGMNGLDVIRCLGALRLLDSTSVMLITAFPLDAALSAMATSAGASDLVTRTLPSSELLCRVDALITARRGLGWQEAIQASSSVLEMSR